MTRRKIKEYLRFKGISVYKFCKDLGFSRSFLDHNSGISSDNLTKILDFFPDLNPQWLLTDHGDMIKPGTVQNSTLNHNNGQITIGRNIKQSAYQEELSYLRRQLEEKDKQLQKKDEQLDKKDEQIASLFDLIRQNQNKK